MSIKELNINDYYFHSIVRDAKTAFDIMNNVIGSRAILSPQLQHKEVKNGCHKDNEICLSHITDNLNSKEYFSCFDIYVNRLMSFIIENQFAKKNKVIKPDLITTEQVFDNIGSFNTSTNLYDEYRTNGRIPFKYIKGLVIPYDDLINDPIKYLTFLDSEYQICFYNGLLPTQVFEEYKNRHNTEKDKLKRIEFMNNYINIIKQSIKKSNVQLPIYYYDNKKLVLK